MLHFASDFLAQQLFCVCMFVFSFTVAKTRNYPNITHYSARAFLVETLKEQKALS
jgi:hypothetical protein